MPIDDGEVILERLQGRSLRMHDGEVIVLQ